MQSESNDFTCQSHLKLHSHLGISLIKQGYKNIEVFIELLTFISIFIQIDPFLGYFFFSFLESV